jgi:hypothetical protein
MDDETNQLLREILNQQTKQTELLQKYLPPLWTKIRFSLLTLLLLTTGVAIALGLLVYQWNRPASASPSPTPIYRAVPPMRSRGGSGPAVLPESIPKPTIG